MKKRRTRPPEEGAPIWMATYADLMSLLLCFFVMLFSMSIISEVKFQALADAIAIDLTGYAGSGFKRTPKYGTVTISADSAARNNRLFALIGGMKTPATEGEATEVHTIALNGETVKNGVICFEFGDDVLTEKSKEALQKMLPELQGVPQKIMVKGYAQSNEAGKMYDNIINHNVTNLAFSRASNVVDYLVSRGLQHECFEIVVDTSSKPKLNLLPPGTDPNLAGATAEIILLHQTLRSSKE